MAITLVSGCRLIDGGGDDNNAPAAISTISGRVVKSVAPVAAQRGSDRPALLAADVTGAVGIAGAEVWLEDLASDPRFRTTTNASGTYLFTDVPPGEHRVIVKYNDPTTGKTMKTRSAGLQVTDTPAPVEAPDLVGEPALNVVTGQLRDAEGNFLPEGTVLTLWGETFTAGKDGAFISPALPESIAEAEIFVQLPGGNNTTRFTAPFVSGVVPAFVELKVGADKNGNHAPNVVVSASASGKSVSKVNPGTLITLIAAGSDANSGDEAALTYTWSVTSGDLTDGSTALEKRWTAPDYFTLATITVEVKDSKNATGKAQLPILVGIDNPSQIDSSRPTVALTADREAVVDSAAVIVTITFNEPVTGFELADISVTNGVLADFSTVTARKVFKVKVTPQAAGEVKVSVAENVVVDLSNNKNTASNIINVTNSITPAKSSEKAITGTTHGTLIGGNVVAVPAGVKVSAFKGGLTVSANATVEILASTGGSAVTNQTTTDVTSTMVIKVTAQDTTSAEYTITLGSSDKAVTATTYGTLSGGNVVAVPAAVKVSAFKTGLTVSANATAEILASTGGSAVTNQTTTDVTSTMVIKVTAQDTTSAEYTITIIAAGDKVTHTAGGVNFKVSYAPAATFPTGSDNSGTQTVAQPFWIGETEVTYELWYAVRTWAVDAARGPNQYTFQNAGREGHDGTNGAAPTGAQNEPVTMVSWRDTVVWCNALSEILGKEPVYRTGGGVILRSSADANAAVVDAAVATANNGFRLPTEWEWELAARWRNDTSNPGDLIERGGRFWTPGNYASGATADYNNPAATQLAAWYSANSGSKTQNAGQKPASGNHLGVHDMSGNVWEWCWDNIGGSNRVFRGGSWDNSAGYVTVGYRSYDDPDIQGYIIGFRVVRP